VIPQPPKLLQTSGKVPPTVANLSALLFEMLKEMDSEAVGTTKNGWPVGLRSYCHYERTQPGVKPRKRDDIEDSWCRRLSRLLKERHDLEVGTFSSYPTKKRTDLVVELPNAGKVWIEIKGAWSYNNRGNCGKPRIQKDDYRKYLYGRPHKCVEWDVAKCACLTTAEASHAGILVIGFDAEEPAKYSISGDEIAVLKTRAGLGDPVWREHYREWPDEHQLNGPQRAANGYRVRCWFWYRQLTAESEKDNGRGLVADGGSTRP
jgi:hypothetical protein